ncbi:MAG: hypothetical protein JSR98_00695 [Proteobacteria bacterium]|nr:hypothetical protein [Pseudomonadota bacterium]
MAPRAILVLDMAGFTNLTAEQGPEAAATAISVFRERAEAFIEAFGGRTEMHVADNVFATFDDVRLAAAAGLAITQDRGSSAGVGWGEVGDFHPDTISAELNFASHAGEDEARHGEVRFTAAAKAALRA